MNIKILYITEEVIEKISALKVFQKPWVLTKIVDMEELLKLLDRQGPLVMKLKGISHKVMAKKLTQRLLGVQFHNFCLLQMSKD